MQTTPLYVSQLAGHLKLPLVKTVQDHTEELFRHRTTLPPLNSTSGTQLHLRVKELLVWALYLHHDSSLRGQRSPKRGGDWGCAGWGRNGGGHLAQPVPSCLLQPRAAPAPPAAQRGPGCISCAGTTNSTLSGGSSECSETHPESELLAAVPSPSPSSQNCVQKTGTNNTAHREHFNATNTPKPCYTLYWKDFAPLQLLWGSICYL